MYMIARRQQRHREQTELFTSFSVLGPHRAVDRRFGPLVRFEETFLQPGANYFSEAPASLQQLYFVIEGEMEITPAVGPVVRLSPRMAHALHTIEGEQTKVRNLSNSHKTRILELWFNPAPESPLTESKPQTADLRKHKGFYAFAPLASKEEEDEGAIRLDVDCQIYFSHLRPNEAIAFESGPDRTTFLFMIKGGLRVIDDRILQGDTALIWNEANLEFTSTERSVVLMFDLPGEVREAWQQPG